VELEKENIMKLIKRKNMEENKIIRIKF